MQAATVDRADDTDSREVFVGRQPILDPSLRTYGYELLFRSREDQTSACFDDPDAATARVVTNAIADIGLDSLVGSARAFVNITARFLTDPSLLELLPPDRSVLEIVEDIEVTPAVIQGVRDLADRGYTLALDDFVPDGPAASLRDLVHIVKYDMSTIDRDAMRSSIEVDHAAGRHVVVERVETEADFAVALDVGADWVQGYFFARPVVVAHGAVAVNDLALVRLVAAINRPDASMAEIVELITQDVSMSVKVLRVVNSAGHGLSTRVDSIRHAAVLIGRDRLCSWATLVTMASMGEQPDALIALSLVRAKFCELLAQRRSLESTATAFTVGMLSLLPAMTNTPMVAVMDQVGVSDEIREALVGRTGPLADVLRVAVGAEDYGSMDMLSDPHAAEVQREALWWASEVTASI